MWAVPAQSHSVNKHSYAVSLVISGPNISQSNPQSVNMTRYLTIQTIQHLHPLYTEYEPEVKMPRFLLIWQTIKIGSIFICWFSYFKNEKNAYLYHKAVLRLNNICKIPLQ